MKPYENMTENSFALRRQARMRKIDAQTLRRIIASFQPYKARIALTLFATLLSTLLGLLSPLIVRLVFDDAIPRRDAHLLVELVLIMLLAPMIGSVVSVWQTYLSNTVGKRVMRDFRDKWYTYLQRMPLPF